MSGKIPPSFYGVLVELSSKFCCCYSLGFSSVFNVFIVNIWFKLFFATSFTGLSSSSTNPFTSSSSRHLLILSYAATNSLLFSGFAPLPPLNVSSSSTIFNHSCYMASLALTLYSGSNSRQLLRNSTNSRSSHWITYSRVLLSGILKMPCSSSSIRKGL